MNEKYIIKGKRMKIYKYIIPTINHKILLILLLFIMTSFYQCDENSKINTVIITGGHDFEREAFFDMFKSFTDIAYEEIIHPDANKIYASQKMETIDVLIFYDMVQDISENQKQDLINLLDKGKSLLFLHHSLASYQHWDDFMDILGGRYYIKKAEEDTSSKPESSYKHDVQVPVTIVNKNHYITKGMENFVIHDETYNDYNISPGIYPLLTTTEETSGDVIGWINHYKKSWIVYLQLGHDHYAYENPNFRRLVHQSIQWLANPQ